ncbi:hypothetical protein IJ182_03290 [bacterium]|nr:hypothetical protein [bacterium]
MKINGDVNYIPEYQQNFIGSNSHEDIDINLFDYDHNGIVEGTEYDDFIKSTQQTPVQETNDESTRLQEAADKFAQELFGNINIPSTVGEYTGIAQISKDELNNKLNTNFGKSYASSATIEFAKNMHNSEDVIYADDKGQEHTISTKEDIKKFKQAVPENPQDIPIGSIVTMDDPKGGNFHSGLLIGYTDDGKALVMEANSAKADGGAAIVAYDFNSSSAKSIKGYIPVKDNNEQEAVPTINPFEEAIQETEDIPEETPSIEETSDVQETDEIEETEETPKEINENPIDETADIELSDEEQLAQAFTDKIFGSGINLKDFPSSEITNDNKGHYIAAGSTTKQQLEAGLGINYGSKYASKAAIDMAKSMLGLSSNDTITDTEGHQITSKEDMQKYGKDIPSAQNGEHPVPIGSMVIADDPKGGNFHAGILVGYTDDGKAIVAEANSAKSTDGSGAALAVYDFNSNSEKSIKKYIPIQSQATAPIEGIETEPISNTEGIEDNNSTSLSGALDDCTSKALKTAYKYLGMTEKEVEKLTGRNFCDGFYCADFVQAVLEESIGTENLPDWYVNCEGKSTSAYVLAAAKDAGVAFTDPDKIQDGHLYLIVFNTKRGKAKHIGFLNKLDGNEVHTIEGNSTKGKVCERTYDKSNTSRINSYILIA